MMRSFRVGILATTANILLSCPTLAKEIIAEQCRSAGDELAQLKCSTAISKERTQALKSRASAAEERGRLAEERGRLAEEQGTLNTSRIKAADAEMACMGLLMKDIESGGAKTANLTEPPKRGNACAVAKALKIVP